MKKAEKTTKEIKTPDYTRKAINNYRKDKKQSRFHILNNYLSSLSGGIRFKNKYQINQAVKNINDELEEAEKEFDKLFKSDDKEMS